MGQFIPDSTLDLALDYIAAHGDRLAVCSAQPTTYAEAVSTYMLAVQTLDSGDFVGPADGDVTGRKLTVSAQANVPVTNAGTATHLAVCDSVGQALLYLTTCPDKALADDDEVNIPGFDITSELAA